MAPVGQTTLLALINSAATLADQPTPSTTTYIPKATWVEWVNMACAELHEKMVEAYGADYQFAAPDTITTDGTNSSFALNDDFFKLLGVDLQLANNAQSWVTIWRYNFASRNQYALPNLLSLWGRTTLKYRLQGSNINFIPLPAAGQTLRLWYAPRFTPLSADGDTFDPINGWDMWVKLRVALLAYAKEESVPNNLQQLFNEQQERLTHIMENRDAGAPSTTVDVYALNGQGGGGVWSGDSGW